MIAFVAPYRKTPRGIDGFDYHVPIELQDQVQPGSVVRIPMRKSVLYGLVLRVTKTPTATATNPRTKDLLDVAPIDIWQASQRIAFVEWFAKTHWVSLPTAWKTLQPQLPAFSTLQKQPIIRAWSSEQARTAQKKAQETLYSYSLEHDVPALYGNILAQHTQPICIITAEDAAAHNLARSIQTISGRTVRVVDSATTPRAWYDIAHKSALGDIDILIGSKRLLFCDLPPTTHVIIHDEHEKAHKQYDANPRYRSTTIAQYLADSGAIAALTLLSYAPSMRSWARVEQERAAYYAFAGTQTPNTIEIVDMKHASSRQLPGWLSEQALTALQGEGPMLVFLNRIGNAILHVCKDCGTTLSKESAACAACGSTLIAVRRKGISQLYHDFATLFPEKTLVRIDSTQADASDNIQDVIASADIVLATEKILHGYDLSVFTQCIVLSVDSLLVYPHFGSQERVFQILMQLAATNAPLLIQTYAPHMSIFSHVQNRNVEGFAREEYALRSFLHLPPETPHWLARMPQSPNMQRIDDAETLKNLPREALIDYIEG